MMARRWWGAALSGLLAGMSAFPLRAEASDLTPAAMLRSLELVQDRIANGDQAAMPMQRKLLEMIDKRFREATDEDFASPDGFQAVLIYAMSGGNPTTFDVLMPRLMKAANGFEAAREDKARKARTEAGEEEEEEPAEDAGHGEAPAEAHGATTAASDSGDAHGEAKPAADGGEDGHGADSHVDAAPREGGHEGAETGHGADAHGEAKADAHGEVGHGNKGHGGEEAAPKPKAAPKERMLLLGVYNYLRGRPQDARAALATMDPMAETPELGAFVALVRGTVEADGDAKAAMGLLDSARLLAPGSLIEEAALRRAAPLAVALGDRAGFLHLSEDYARRFLFSPYASQWADSFVNGVMALRDGLELSALDGVATVLDTERRQVLFLRIARRAAIEHDQALADFATSRAEGGATKGGDAQAKLYAALPAITSEKGAEALKSLESIDPMGLSESDRELLATAKALAAELSAPPPAATVEAAPSPSPAETDAPVQAEPASVVEPAVAHADQAAPLAAPASAEKPEPLAEIAEAAGTRPAPAPSPDQAAETAASAQLNEARKTLADIDRLLEATN